MAHFLPVLAVFILSMTGMAVGVICRHRALERTCGGGRQAASGEDRKQCLCSDRGNRRESCRVDIQALPPAAAPAEPVDAGLPAVSLQTGRSTAKHA